MRYVQINTVATGSTGGIMSQIDRIIIDSGDESWCLWGRGKDSVDNHHLRFANELDCRMHGIRSRFTAQDGFYSKSSTKRLLGLLDDINPDFVHLHNLHGHYLNVELLFEWLTKKDCRVKWTLHDCWAFTGHCPHFISVGCMQWKAHCATNAPCPLRHQNTWMPNDIGIAKCFERKRKCFTALEEARMTLVTPSQWLADLVEESFLSKYPVEVRHNTIDTSIFKPTVGSFRKRYELDDRFIILGVASPWTERKGLYDFVRLSKDIDLSRYAIVLVGLTDEQIRTLPESILCFKRTESKEELAELYSAADVLFNPTQEDNYPTVNLEAQACGTPVCTYDIGGCRETLSLSESQLVNYDSFVTWLHEHAAEYR